MLTAASVLAQEAAGIPSDPEKRLQWLNSRMPPKPAAAPKPAETPKPAPAPKIGFRSSTSLTTRPVAIEPETPAPSSKKGSSKTAAKASPTPSGSSKKRTADTGSAKTKATPTPAPSEEMPEAPTKKSGSGSAIAKASPTPKPEAKPDATPRVTIAKASPTPKGATTSITKASPTPKATPASIAKASPTPKASPAPIAKASPTPKPTATPKIIASSKSATKPSLEPAITVISPTKMIITGEPRYPTGLPGSSTSSALTGPTSSVVGGRYPWKTDIVTTVFWVGEPPSGNNFTPNHASSWDANWAGSYGGFDNPDPSARRNYIPVRFTPRQNPFYCALPYNDVTRGTTKPEARRCIPWFKTAFVREGQSVCRDRWVAIRSRSGRVAYAQWSDCGPFRTDHWQYVFGPERPRPNLNKGAGLDVSPAVRDYLGLSSTDVTDWKFVEVRDVPAGPWTLYGQNNIFAMKGARPAKTTAESTRTRGF